MEFYYYLIAIGGGFLAGILNAIAGFGSVITLGIMIEFMGMPANLANGTNRINVFVQSSMSSLAYYQKGKLGLNKCKYAIIASFIGAMFGVILAINISNEVFKSAFQYILIIMLLVVLINPKRWLIDTDINFKMNKWISIPLFLILGFYGGFIQMGMGLFALIVLVLIARFNLVEANALKVFIVSLYTIVLIFIFNYRGLVDWQIGLTFAVGQGLGGYLAAHYASVYPKANVWIYRILVLVIIVVILKTFGVFSYL